MMPNTAMGNEPEGLGPPPGGVSGGVLGGGLFGSVGGTVPCSRAMSSWLAAMYASAVFPSIGGADRTLTGCQLNPLESESDVTCFVSGSSRITADMPSRLKDISVIAVPHAACVYDPLSCLL